MQTDIVSTTQHSQPDLAAFRHDVLQGLRRPQKELPCKYFYDERGSDLFEQICELSEYYPTRTETAILQDNIVDIANTIGRRCLLVEFGSGSSAKTRILLDHLEDIAAYVPIDISGDQLDRAAARVRSMYPSLEVFPICADYTKPLELPSIGRAYRKIVAFFPGSTIGNFEPHEAVLFLRTAAALCDHGALLIGIDLKKDPLQLHHAYNDASAVTAEFNLNLLRRINRELGADFELDRFRHYAYFNPIQGRIEMHLVSLADQIVTIGDTQIRFRRGESIWTESSYKYDLESFRTLAAQAGFSLGRVWQDQEHLFSVLYMTADSPSANGEHNVA